MRLTEALMILRENSDVDAALFRIFLLCGFTPLHLQTFLAARLKLALPQRRVEIQTGLYGDFLGSLARLKREPADGAVLVMEWADLDARLGLRSLGGWRLSDFTDIQKCVRSRIAQIENTIDALPEHLPLAICLPTLPLPPIQSTVPTWKAGLLDLQLREYLASFALRAASHENVKVVNAEWLDQISPPGERFDAKAEMLNGFPYKLPHADAVGELLSCLILQPAPKKGLITDLDNTLWRGIVGEVGAGEISWDLDHKSHMHAIYQELLRSLAATGILIGVASKNDPAQVDEAFARHDLILKKELIFPFEVHWNHKVHSVARILNSWNILPDSVVFVDDSPAEIAEVKAAYPEMECLQFPGEPGAVCELIARLRNLFAKVEVTEEDKIRLASIRSMEHFRVQSHDLGNVSDEFLQQAESELTLDFGKTLWDPRVLELLNKTNQFNLNGKRFTEVELRSLLEQPDVFLLKASYQDKFGPLGKIGVLIGRTNGRTLHVCSWVMSCRAFSRRIEHACLNQLFEKFPAEEVLFDFMATERNKPLQEFFSEVVGEPSQTEMRLSKASFAEKCPRLFHRVREEVNE